MAKIIIKEPDKEIQIKETKEATVYRCSKEYIDDSVESVPLNQERTLWMCVDDNGIYKKLPTNFYMEYSENFPVARIAGIAVFIKTSRLSPWIDREQQVEDITDSDIELINNMLNKDYQARLERMFDNYY